MVIDVVRVSDFELRQDLKHRKCLFVDNWISYRLKNQKKMVSSHLKNQLFAGLTAYR